MSNTTSAAAGSLSQEVTKILEVPPRWVIRNGGFLLIAYICAICILFNAIEIPDIVYAKLNLSPIGLSKANELVGTVAVPERYAPLVKQGNAIQLTEQSNNKNNYQARITSVVKHRDSCIIEIRLTKQNNKFNYTAIMENPTNQFTFELGKSSLFSAFVKCVGF